MRSCSSSRREDSNSTAEHRDRVPCGDTLPGLTSTAVKLKRLRREKPAMGQGAGPHLLPHGLGPNVGAAASPAGARRPRVPAAAPTSPPRPSLRLRAARSQPPRGHREAAGARRPRTPGPGLAPPGRPSGLHRALPGKEMPAEGGVPPASADGGERPAVPGSLWRNGSQILLGNEPQATLGFCGSPETLRDNCP